MSIALKNLRWWLLVTVMVASLLPAGVAIAKSKSKVTLKAPSTIHVGTTIMITAKGRAKGKADQLFRFAGVGISCKSKFKAEQTKYPVQELTIRFYPHGKFTDTWSQSPGPGNFVFCAYLVNGASQHTYARAKAQITVTP